ncbi:hypothetical protein N9W34_03720 [Rickettsiales bacterium]|nr:hypothetical protein [Rickettsiales bacterium]
MLSSSRQSDEFFRSVEASVFDIVNDSIIKRIEETNIPMKIDDNDFYAFENILEDICRNILVNYKVERYVIKEACKNISNSFKKIANQGVKVEQNGRVTSLSSVRIIVFSDQKSDIQIQKEIKDFFIELSKESFAIMKENYREVEREPLVPVIIDSTNHDIHSCDRVHRHRHHRSEKYQKESAAAEGSFSDRIRGSRGSSDESKENQKNNSLHVLDSSSGAKSAAAGFGRMVKSGRVCREKLIAL